MQGTSLRIARRAGGLTSVSPHASQGVARIEAAGVDTLERLLRSCGHTLELARLAGAGHKTGA